MPSFLRLVPAIVCLPVMVVALAESPRFRDTAFGRAVRPLVAEARAVVKAEAPALAGLGGSSAIAVAGPADLPAVVALAQTALPARYVESSRSDLTVHPIAYDCTPRPDQGIRYRTSAGTVWWDWAPPGEAAPRAAIILLHGANRPGESMVDMWRKTAERHGLILIAPDLGGVEGWSRGLPDPARLLDALEAAKILWSVDPERIALFDHSRGGIAAQLIANRVAGPWKAVAVHAGTAPGRLMQQVRNDLPIRHDLSALRIGPFLSAMRAALDERSLRGAIGSNSSFWKGTTIGSTPTARRSQRRRGAGCEARCSDEVAGSRLPIGLGNTGDDRSWRTAQFPADFDHSPVADHRTGPIAMRMIRNLILLLLVVGGGTYFAYSPMGQEHGIAVAYTDKIAEGMAMLDEANPELAGQIRSLAASIPSPDEVVTIAEGVAAQAGAEAGSAEN
ncbi:alpha/beta hydrolase [Jannaschia aquimarina]|uniref:Alpha/beta hydrolase family protein n=1 Tax=Jannaschia aquimarina TaxID=935700 RepID=A0A0D1EAA8_9RHOB|nr:alpha/beta hydrolase [Jannaschia aquimarina]KIT14624.1 Alpha/beta hydrolase family protein [Jannaschia aquimarina]SNS46046.1 hypothetical protein SAMN05421775_10131 [Jannaschia aquimarina]